METAPLTDFTPEDLAYGSLIGWAGYCDPTWYAYPHLRYLCEKLEEVAYAIAQGRRKKVMVFMPSQHGKSNAVSRFFTSWLLGRWPSTRVIFASYEASFAALWGRRSRDMLAAFGQKVFGVQVKQDSKAADHWELAPPHRGVFHSSGVSGSTTGHPAECVVIDDPVKNREDAESPTIREKTIEWYKSVVITRRPKGVVLLMTRWHVMDLAGWLLETEGDDWEVIRFPALAEENDVLGRKPGEPLCSAMAPLEVFQRERKTVGSYVWASMYEQQPMPAGGARFKRHDARFYRLEGRDYVFRDTGDIYTADQMRRFITVDTATSSKTSADMSCIATWGVDNKDRLILLDVDMDRIEGPEIMRRIVQMCRRWETSAFVEENPTAKHLLSFMQREGISFCVVKPGSQDKFTRALPAMGMWEQGRVVLPEHAEYLPAIERQLYRFTGADGGEDDFVDCLAYAARVHMDELSSGGIPSPIPGSSSKGKSYLPSGMSVKRPLGF